MCVIAHNAAPARCARNYDPNYPNPTVPRTTSLNQQVDFICNWLGNQAWALGLEWSGKAAFNAASMKPWSVDGAPAGLVRNSGAFTFLRVFDAGQ